MPRGWIQRRLCPYIIYQRTVALVLISRQHRLCSPREFHRTVSLGRPWRISYGISSGKDPNGNRGQSFNKYEHAGLPIQNDFIHGDCYGGRGYNIWSTTSPPPVSGVHRSSGVGETFESFTIILSGQIGTRKCYGGSRKPTKGRWFYDVESSNSGTVCDVVASDVSRNVEYWCGSCGIPGGRSRQAVGNAEGPASSQVHDSDRPVAPSVGPGAPGPLPTSTCPSCMNCEYCFWQKRAIGSVTMLTF